MSNAIDTSENVFCRQCGKIIHKNDRYCATCGAKQFTDAPGAHEAITTSEWPNRGVAIVLALFLGGFGLHKFYLKQYGMGIIYAVFFWTFIPSILGLIEAIGYLTFSDDDFRRKCNEWLQPNNNMPRNIDHPSP